MFRKAFAIVIVSSAAATSGAAQASDWDQDGPRHAPATERHSNEHAWPQYGAPRYAPPHWYAPAYHYPPPAYRYAPPPYRWAPPPYRWAPPPHAWRYPAYAYRGYYDRAPRYCPER